MKCNRYTTEMWFYAGLCFKCNCKMILKFKRLTFGVQATAQGTAYLLYIHHNVHSGCPIPVRHCAQMYAYLYFLKPFIDGTYLRLNPFTLFYEVNKVVSGKRKIIPQFIPGAPKTFKIMSVISLKFRDSFL
jgi:hypothetical protein